MLTVFSSGLASGWSDWCGHSGRQDGCVCVVVALPLLCPIPEHRHCCHFLIPQSPGLRHACGGEGTSPSTRDPCLLAFVQLRPLKKITPPSVWPPRKEPAASKSFHSLPSLSKRLESSRQGRFLPRWSNAGRVIFLKRLQQLNKGEHRWRWGVHLLPACRFYSPRPGTSFLCLPLQLPLACPPNLGGSLVAAKKKKGGRKEWGSRNRR